MKKILFALIIILASFACEDNCENQAAACAEATPPDEACLAYFVRWFYNDATKTCTEIGYSGCEQYGFATEAECEACLCAE